LSSPDRYEPDPGRTAADSSRGSVVVVQLAAGVYYTLDGVAAVIWQMVIDGLGVPSMVETLVASYDVDPSQAGRDVRRVLDELEREGVIRAATAEAAAAQPNAPTSRAPYVTPVVGVYRGMQDLLALDPPL
jgi:hypothetical protein